MIKLTNVSDGREGDPLYINKDWIVCMYEDHLPGNSLKTVVYGGPSGITWFVEESLNEIMNKINESQ